MAKQHPITPPPELVQQLISRIGGPTDVLDEARPALVALIHQAYAAGADQELEACLDWMRGSKTPFIPCQAADQLHDARRPKPPSLADQALQALDEMDAPLGNVTAARCGTIRAALERLKELEELHDEIRQ